MRSISKKKKKQSRVPVSLVLHLTSCFRWLGLAIELEHRPVEVGLKSPVKITIAFVCFER